MDFQNWPLLLSKQNDFLPWTVLFTKMQCKISENIADTRSQSQPFYRFYVVLNYAELKLEIVEQHKMFLFQGAQ